MTTQHLNAAARQEQILDAARRLFLTKGYEATTIEDVLTAVGIAKGTLYHHFPGKEAILDAIVLRTVDAIVQRPPRPASSPSSARPAPRRRTSSSPSRSAPPGTSASTSWP